MLATRVVVLSVDSKKAKYMGGTLTGMKEGVEGRLDSASESALGFNAGKNGALAIPYASIDELEYGQKAGRRVGMAIMLSPLVLFSKKRKHWPP